MWGGIKTGREDGGDMSNASGSWSCGVLWEEKWLQIACTEWPGFETANIAAKELFPIVVAAATWGSSWRGQVMCCHCDNQAVVAALNGGYCREKLMAHLLRCLFFLEAKHELSLTAVHVRGVDNGAADAISRNKPDVFFRLCLHECHRKIPVNQDIIRQLALDVQWTSDTWKRWLAALSMLQ